MMNVCGGDDEDEGAEFVFVLAVVVVDRIDWGGRKKSKKNQHP